MVSCVMICNVCKVEMRVFSHATSKAQKDSEKRFWCTLFGLPVLLVASTSTFSKNYVITDASPHTSPVNDQ